MSVQIQKENGLAWIVLDKPGDKVNILDKELIEGFSRLLDELQTDQESKAVVFISGKDENFIAGADISMFDTFSTKEEFAEFIKKGTDLLDRIESFPKPVIAAINGSCMGGGLELALACHYRIFTDDASTKCALPEVRLGLLPGAGGTQRLPKTVGLPNALDMMLTGKTIYPRQAKRMGLADLVTHRFGLRQAAEWAAAELASGRFNRKPLKGMARLLTHTPLRALAFKEARKTVLKQTKGNYPAPLKIIESAAAGLRLSRSKGFETERNLFTGLAFTPESASLRSLFFGMQAVKKNPSSVKAEPVERIGMIGAGLMGSGIADVTAAGGIRVVLKDRDEESAFKGAGLIKKEAEKKVSKRILSRFQADAFLARIFPTGKATDLAGIPLVIEAVFEDLQLKHRIIREIEAVSPDVIFASNTSSLPISDIAKGAKKPENVIGMHYFSPVQKMPLLEIIVTEQTSDRALSLAYEIGLKQGKTIIVVKDGPGFYTTRILAPFINEALLLLEEGAAIEDIEKSLTGFGFPVGPIALIDEVGIDVAAHVGEVLSPMFKARGANPSTAATKIYGEGILGRKGGKGFYSYPAEGSGKKKKKTTNTDIYQFFGGSARKKIASEEIRDRMALIMVNEALLCLEEGILSSPRDGDLGAVLGLGFPPFLGGPFHWIDQFGAGKISDMLGNLKQKHGPRFKAANILAEYAKDGKKFRS
ncbi:MAG: enoyl-CoA hydratase/isomerase family protein [Balneolales bacterium]|nr:enoyl-CoA hydratase/isomerase family protein [Balneolales bacterium]